MTFNSYLPPKTLAFLVKIADEHDLSWKEVQRIVLNKVFFEMGMKCEHKRISKRKNDNDKDSNKFHCKDCWSRFISVRDREYNPETRHWHNIHKFIPMETFLDEIENKKNLQVHGDGQVKVQDREEYV